MACAVLAPNDLLRENARLRADNDLLRHENARLLLERKPHAEAARNCFDAKFLRDALTETEVELAHQLRLAAAAEAAAAEEAREAAALNAVVLAELPGADLSRSSSATQAAEMQLRDALLVAQATAQAYIADLQETEGQLALQVEHAREAAARQAAIVAELPAVELQAVREATVVNAQATGSILDRGARRHEGSSGTGGTQGTDTEPTDASMR